MIKRRELLAGLGVLPFALRAVAQDTAKKSDDKEPAVEYLFVQVAEKCSLKDGVLKLSDVGSSTIYFADRPHRDAGHIHTKSCVESWSKGGDDSFENDPPNAALSLVTKKDSKEFVVVLSKPRLKGKDLLYDVKVLEGDENVEGGPGSLFIDVIGRPLTPVSFAGGRRRVRRRTRRRTARRHGW